jgi:hypothetical protein
MHETSGAVVAGVPPAKEKTAAASVRITGQQHF